MKKTLLSLLTIFLLINTLKAQDFPFGNVSVEELSMKKYAKDTSAHAVVLNEYGTATIGINNLDEMVLTYNYHVKTKIFDAQGFNEGNVDLVAYESDGQRFEKIDDIKGLTTYIDESGMIKKVQLDPDKVFTIKDDQHHTSKKFALPGLHNGCVIEYSYTLESPYFENFQPWRFQAAIPKMHSEYDVHIPGIVTYNASIRGNLKLTKHISELEQKCFNYAGATADCSHLVFGIDDIPAFIEEDYMTSANNYISGIYFELSDYTSLSTGANIKVAKEWKDVDFEMKHADYFGGQIKRKGLLEERIAPVIAGKTDTLAKAKAIYAFIQKTIKWDENDDYGSVDGIKKALDSHRGNAADINLALVAGLNAAGINVEAVLLSTRKHGIVNKLYPAVGDFNYVVGMVNIGGKNYLLDATDPLLSFGMLPMRCLNDQGRVMSLDKPSYWIDMATPQRQTTTYSLNLTLDKEGKIKGTLTEYSMGYAAYEKRAAIKKYNTIDEYVEARANESRFKILKSDISNVDSLDEPIAEQYEIEIKEFDHPEDNHLVFNPFILDRLNNNPFKLADRSYPVDWGMPSTDRFVLTMHIPDNYIIDDAPKDQGIALPDGGGSFITTFQTDSNTFTFSHVTQFNKSVYQPIEYPYLKELYTKIISCEKGEMIFKKK